MATIKMLSPTGSNLSSKIIDIEKRTKLTITRNSNPWLYSNYPEAIGKNNKGLALAENKYFLNQQRVSGTAEIFFSHTNYTTSRLYVRVQAFNESSSTVTVTCDNYGGSAGWGKSIDAVKDFFSWKKTEVEIASGKGKWITPELSVPAGTSKNGVPFTGMCRFTSSGSVIVTVYAYRSESAVDGTAKAFPYDTEHSADGDNHTYPPVYSGRGTGYYLTFNHGTKYVSDLLNKPYIYTSNDKTGYGNNNEIIPIELVESGLTASIDASHDDLTNLGNWCAHNFNTITFKNDTNKTYTIYGYVGSTGTCQTINYGGTVMGLTLGAPNNTWRWCEVVIAPNESCTVSWQHVVASYGTGASRHEWSIN